MIHRVQRVLHFRGARPFLFGALLVAAALFQYSLLKSEFANGKDGYWYVIQLQSLFEEGALHSYESTLLYPLYALFYFLTGDYITGLRLSLVFASLFCAFTLFLLCQKIYRQMLREGAAQNGETGFFSGPGADPELPLLAISLLVILSPTPLFLGVQYPKQALALGFLWVALIFLWPALVRLYRATFSQAPPLWKLKKRDLFLGGAFLFAALLSHRLIFGLLVAFCGAFFLQWLLARGGRRFLLGALGAVFGGAVALFAISQLIPGVFQMADLERLSRAFVADWYCPPCRYAGYASFHPLAVAELLLPWAGAGFLLWRRKSVDVAPAFLFVLCAFVFMVPLFDFFDLQIRLLATGSLLGWVVFAILATVCHLKRAFAGRRYLLWVGALMALVCVFHLHYFFYRPDKFEHDYPSYQILIEKSGQVNAQHQPELIIAHTGLAQFYEFHTGIDVLPWSPEERFDKTKTWRFVYGIKDYTFLHRLELLDASLMESAQSYVILVNDDYLYVREDHWELLKKTLPLQYDEKLEETIDSWRNPTRVRPAYIVGDVDVP